MGLDIEGCSSCCGILELMGSEHAITLDEFKAFVTPRKKERDKWGYYRDDDEYERLEKGYIYLISCTDKGYGPQIVKWIKKYDLGTVEGSSRWGKNPNSGNKLKVWLWRYNGKHIPKDTAAKKRATKSLSKQSKSNSDETA